LKAVYNSFCDSQIGVSLSAVGKRRLLSSTCELQLARGLRLLEARRGSVVSLRVASIEHG
jgi:hypothetical protein